MEVSRRIGSMFASVSAAALVGCAAYPTNILDKSPAQINGEAAQRNAQTPAIGNLQGALEKLIDMDKAFVRRTGALPSGINAHSVNQSINGRIGGSVSFAALGAAAVAAFGGNGAQVVLAGVGGAIAGNAYDARKSDSLEVTFQRYTALRTEFARDPKYSIIFENIGPGASYNGNNNSNQGPTIHQRNDIQCRSNAWPAVCYINGQWR